MSPVLLTFLSLAAYICGLVMLVKVTPHLLKRNFDEGFFMGIAAADVFAGLLIFGQLYRPSRECGRFDGYLSYQVSPPLYVE